MISTQQIQYILVLAEERHFQRASEHCFVTQPTLSLQIKKAEEDLKHLIFDRTTQPLSLTPFGEKLIPILRDLQSEINKIDILVKTLEGSYIEKLRIGIIPTISAYLVSDMFKTWKNVLKNSQLIIQELRTEDLLSAIEKKEIDMGILAGPVHQHNLRSIPLFQEEIKAYVPNHKEKTISTKDLNELHPWLLSKGNCLRTQMIHFCNIQENEKESWNYEGGNLELLIRMVDQYGGYTLVPQEFDHILNLNPKHCKRILSSGQEVPAREIIALFPYRTSKWESIEKLVRTCQIRYNTENKNKNLTVLSWK